MRSAARTTHGGASHQDPYREVDGAPEERQEIESHVTHSFRFLRQIPWTNDLRRIPVMAYAHHEKLNGSGYPSGLRGDDIPLQSKMMMIGTLVTAQPWGMEMPGRLKNSWIFLAV